MVFQPPPRLQETRRSRLDNQARHGSLRRSPRVLPADGRAAQVEGLRRLRGRVQAHAPAQGRLWEEVPEEVRCRRQADTEEMRWKA